MDKKIKYLEDELDKHAELYNFKIKLKEFIEEKNYLSEMESAERKEFLSMASSIYKNKAFDAVVSELMSIQASHSILQAPNSKIVEFDRAGINAMQLLKDEFQKLDKMFKDLTDPEEDYDKHAVI
jgi:hypothetical protein